MEGTWDRSRAHGDDIDFGAELLEELFLPNAKALLLVDDDEAEILESDIPLHQTMRADDDIDRSVRQALDRFALLFV